MYKDLKYVSKCPRIFDVLNESSQEFPESKVGIFHSNKYKHLIADVLSGNNHFHLNKCKCKCSVTNALSRVIDYPQKHIYSQNSQRTHLSSGFSVIIFQKTYLSSE